MLQIIDQVYFDEVKKFATDTNQIQQFNQQLDYLDNYACSDESPNKTRCFLGRDFAPYSFSFSMQILDQKTKEYKRWFNGGLIYHGSHDNGGDGGAPTFSVNLSPVQGWSIHT